jgi:putative FmdB family regulatory protein
MPIYAYRCESCGHELDKLQKISDAPLVDCPACGKAALVKKVTAAGFQLKGTGWYVTDFRNGQTAPATKGEDAKADAKSEPKSSDGSKDVAAGDSKPAPASESTTAGGTPAATPAAPPPASTPAPATTPKAA